MAGVQRSQGCRTCRRGRKGCDLQKPVCGRCARLGIMCRWDERRWTFVTQSPGRSGSSSATRTNPNQGPASAPPSPLLSHAPIDLTDRLATSIASSIQGEDDFWSLFLPRNDPEAVIDIGGFHTAPWANTVQELARHDETIRTVISACGMTILGQIHADPGLCQQAIGLYSKALLETNQALQDPVRAQSDEVLATCMLSALFEILRHDPANGIPRKGHDWQQHVRGICRIIQLHGASQYAEEHGHNLFKEARMTATLSAILLREPNFLGDLTWRTVPWEAGPRSRNLRDELCDAMLLLPELLRTHDALLGYLRQLNAEQRHSHTMIQGREHLHRCITVGDTFQQWERKALAASVEKIAASAIPAASSLTLFDICKIHGYGFFHAVMLYWASCLILYVSTWIAFHRMSLATALEQTALEQTTLPEIPGWMDAKNMASNIVENISHYVVPEAGFWGAESSIFPVGIVLHYYAATAGNSSQQLDRICGMLQTNSRGQISSGLLRSLAYHNDPRNRDAYDREQHRSMANEWFGIHALE